MCMKPSPWPVRMCARQRTLLSEIKTYRYKGHSMSDPQKYRTKEEVEGYKKQDPIESVRDTILENKWAKEAELEPDR
jgi:TPP-dependent pyruvate/acetoin dehydrogenase alpha subunit